MTKTNPSDISDKKTEPAEQSNTEPQKDTADSRYKVPFFISSLIVVALFFSLIAVLYIQHASVRQLEFYEDSVFRSMPTAGETDSDLQVNINTAGIKELTLLPGIGESRAKDIIDYRNEYGLFTEPEDLLNIRGIGKSTLENLLPYIVFETPD